MHNLCVFFIFAASAFQAVNSNQTETLYLKKVFKKSTINKEPKITFNQRLLY